MSDLKPDINYSIVNEIIEKERHKYIDFLKSNTSVNFTELKN